MARKRIFPEPLMAKRPRTTDEYYQLQREFSQVELEWHHWLGINLPRFGNIEDAWLTFKSQRQGNLLFLDIDAVYNVYRAEE